REKKTGKTHRCSLPLVRPPPIATRLRRSRSLSRLVTPPETAHHARMTTGEERAEQSVFFSWHGFRPKQIRGSPIFVFLFSVSSLLFFIGFFFALLLFWGTNLLPRVLLLVGILDAHRLSELSHGRLCLRVHHLGLHHGLSVDGHLSEDHLRLGCHHHH